MELTPQQMAQEWKAGKFRPVYYLVGEDGSARKAAAEALKKALKPDPFNVNEFGGEAEEAVASALMPPVFSDRRLVILKDAALPASARRTLAEYLADPLESTTLVLHAADRKPDIRDALCAAAAALGGVVVFKPLSEEEAARRLEAAAKSASRTLDCEAAGWIVEEAGTSWSVLEAELAKLVHYTRGRERITQEDALACLGYRKNSNPFDFPRLLQSRALKPALELLRRLLAEGTDEFRLLYQVTASLQKQLKAKRMQAAGLSEDKIFRELRLNAYWDRQYLRQASSLSEASLIDGLWACAQAESALKSKAWLEPQIELERLLARICSSKGATA